MSDAQSFEQLTNVAGQSAVMPRAPLLTDYVDPFKFDSPSQFRDVMLESLAHRSSDVFVTPGKPIVASIGGKLMTLTKVLDDAEVKNILKWACNRDTAITDIVSGIPINTGYELFDLTRRDSRGARIRYRYRVNASPIQFRGGTSAQIVLRSIPNEPPTFDVLGLTEELVRKATPKDGLVLIAGPTGSGKTTTFSAIIRFIMENNTPIKGNLVTHEEPIEYGYDTLVSSHSIIAQSQVPTHFADFYAANKEAMRRKPGLILIGEMRDEQTIRAAVEASLTGHPVFGTVHATDVPAVMRRLISRFPKEERATAIFDVIETLRFVMAQRLIPAKHGGLIAAREYLTFTEHIREQLIDLDDMGRVTSEVKTLVNSEGHSFQKEAAQLLTQDLITPEVAIGLAKSS